jgi:hypothetical protein
MYRAIWRAIPAVLLVVFLAGVPAGTQTPRTAAPKLDDQAMAILKRMADFLSQAQRISVMVDIGFDVVQASGEKIEFGETVRTVLAVVTVTVAERCDVQLMASGLGDVSANRKAGIT